MERKTVRTHSDRKPSEKFRMPRERMDRKYFLGPLNGHVFSPYFRVSERSGQFFAPQHRTLRTLRSMRSFVRSPIHPPGKNTRFPQQRN